MTSTEDTLVKYVGPVIQMGMYNVLSRQPGLATVNPNMDAERIRPPGRAPDVEIWNNHTEGQIRKRRHAETITNT
jgi:hypothetical protein